MQNQDQSLDFSMVLASCIHDMKNSLSMLLSKIDEFDHDNHVAKESSDIDQLKFQGKRVSDNLIQLLVLYRISETEYFANIGEHNVRELLEDCLDPHLLILEHKNVEVVINCEDDLFWFFDRDLIEGVINNIINNLYKHTKSKIQFNVSLENDQLKIDILDDGQGYPESILDTETNQQKEFSFKSGNTGLGLYFASIAASMHKNNKKQGFINVCNEGVNGGGCFTLMLP